MIFKFTLAMVFLSFPFSVMGSEENESEAFFQKYQSLSDQYDVAVADLYSNEAKVIALRILPDGTEQKTILDGKKWKQLLADSMAIAKQRGDNSKFSNIVIAKDGKTVKITASRYSAIKCFVDKDYYVVVKKNPDGQFEIIEEFATSPLQSRCASVPQDDLALVLQGTVITVNKQLPIMVDSDTRLEKTSSEGNRLIYHYELVNYASTELDRKAFMDTMEPVVVQQTCTMINFKSVLELGGTMSYRYVGKDRVQIGEVEVNKQSCK